MNFYINLIILSMLICLDVILTINFNFVSAFSIGWLLGILILGDKNENR
jgi:hypothetical protein